MTTTTTLTTRSTLYDKAAYFEARATAALAAGKPELFVRWARQYHRVLTLVEGRA
jgi:hypothetical protein